jgi:hypothetical protein
MANLEPTKPESKGNGLLSRKTTTKPKKMSELDIVNQYLQVIREERGNINNVE